MKKLSQAPVPELRPGASRIGFLVVTLGHGLAIATVAALDWPPWARLALGTLVLVSAVRGARQQRRASGMAIRIDTEGGIEIEDRQRNLIHGRVVPGSFVTPAFTTLCYLPEDARLARSIAIWPDSLPPDAFRALRVWLKLKSAKPEAKGDTV